MKPTGTFCNFRNADVHELFFSSNQETLPRAIRFRPGKLEKKKMPEALEKPGFALSCDSFTSARDPPTTYVLDPAKGYVLSRKGTNRQLGCIVVRSDWQWVG